MEGDKNFVPSPVAKFTFLVHPCTGGPQLCMVVLIPTYLRNHVECLEIWFCYK